MLCPTTGSEKMLVHSIYLTMPRRQSIRRATRTSSKKSIGKVKKRQSKRSNRQKRGGALAVQWKPFFVNGHMHSRKHVDHIPTTACKTSNEGEYECSD